MEGSGQRHKHNFKQTSKGTRRIQRRRRKKDEEKQCGQILYRCRSSPAVPALNS
jgi:hypothetical protein